MTLDHSHKDLCLRVLSSMSWGNIFSTIFDSHVNAETTVPMKESDYLWLRQTLFTWLITDFSGVAKVLKTANGNESSRFRLVS